MRTMMTMMKDNDDNDMMTVMKADDDNDDSDEG